MPKNKVSDWSSTPANNTDIGGINIAEGCAPSGINNAIRELMAQVKDLQTGSDSDNLVVGGGLTVSGATVLSGTVVASGAVTFSSNVVLSGTVTMSGTNNIGATTTSSTIISGTATLTTDAKLYLDDAATTASAPALSWDGDTNTGIYRPAADTIAIVTGGTDRVRINSSGVLIVGSGEATSSVAGNILRAPSASGSDIAGTNFEIQAGNGTGTGGSGSIILKTAAAGSSSSTANTLTQRLLITKNGGFSFGSGATSYGTAGQFLKSNGDAPPSFASITDQTGDAPIFAARAWVSFDGSKDTTGAASTANTDRLILASGNVTKVTRSGTGIYAITFTTAMPSANYAVMCSMIADTSWGSGNDRMLGIKATGGVIANQTTTSVTVAVETQPVDPSRASVTIFA